MDSSFRFLVSGTWILDFNRLWDSRFLELNSGFHKKKFPDSGFHKKNFPGSWIWDYRYLPYCYMGWDQTSSVISIQSRFDKSHFDMNSSSEIAQTFPSSMWNYLHLDWINLYWNQIKYQSVWICSWRFAYWLKKFEVNKMYFQHLF